MIKHLIKMSQGRKDSFWLMTAEGLLYMSWDPRLGPKTRAVGYVSKLLSSAKT